MTRGTSTTKTVVAACALQEIRYLRRDDAECG
jgi:hypothetical protein